MKFNNKTIFAILIFFSLIIMMIIYFANSKSDLNIKIINVKDNLYVGDKIKLDVEIINGKEEQYKIKWNSSNPEIVQIDENGFIIAKMEGTSKITAIYTDKNNYDVIESISINVLLKDVSLPSEVYFESDYVGINIGAVYKLPLKIVPEEVSLNGIKYTSSNNSCVTVSSDGTITGLKYGKSTITMTSFDGMFNDEIEVIVSNEYNEVMLMDEPKELNFNYNEVKVFEGESLKLDYVVEPSSVLSDLIEWSSGNKNIATISNGVVKALNVGKSIISAKLPNGNLSYVIVEVVKNEIIDLKVEPASILLKKGENIKVNLQGNLTGEINYIVSDNSVVTVSNDGVVSAIKEGLTTISMILNDNVVNKIIVNVTNDEIYKQNIDNNNDNSENISLLLKSSSNNLRGSYNQILSSYKGMTVGIYSVSGVNNISKVEYCVYTYGENVCNNFTQINDINSDFYIFNSIGKYALRMKVVDDKNNIIYKTYYVSIKNPASSNNSSSNNNTGNNNSSTTGSGSVDSTCGKKAQILTAYVNGKIIDRYEKITISMGETLTIRLYLTKNCGTIKQLTRTSPDGVSGWKDVFSQTSSPSVNRYDSSTWVSTTHFDWIIKPKKKTNGEYWQLSQTTFQSTSNFSEIKSFFNVYVKVVD